MEKKYKCEVSLEAEEETIGYIYLTKEQYETVKYAADISNWEVVEMNDWCGSFSIHCDELENN